MDFGIANVAVITALVYVVGLLIKNTPIDNKWIPSICGVCGIILGIVAFYVKVPDYPASDILTAAAVGAVSGAAATWVDQMYDQLSNKKTEIEFIPDDSLEEEEPEVEDTDEGSED